MADRIRGITVEINGDTTKLNESLKSVDKQISHTATELKDVNKLLKLDPTNTTLIRQKVQLLGKETQSTKDRLKQLQEAQAQLDASGADKSSEQYRGLQREIINTQEKLKGLEKQSSDWGTVAGAQLEAYGGKWQSAGDKITDAGNKFIPVTATLTAAGTAGVVAGTQFENSFAKLSTIADASEVSADKLKQQVMDVSNATGVSASEVAESMYSAISAGRDTADAADFVTKSIMLQKAGFTDAATATDTLTTIMNAYGDSAGSAESISDKLITTQNLGKTTVAELGASMGKVIPTAAMYGVNLDNLSAAYVATTKNGIGTAESTTYINGMLNELGKSGTTASNILKEKTGKSFSELMASGMSLSDVLGIVQQSADESGMSMADMFGSQEAAKAAATITQHADDFNDALVQMGDSAGTTGSAYELMEQTGSASLEKLKTSAQNSLIAIGSALMPIVEKVAGFLQDLTDKFQALDPAQQQMIVTIGLVVAAIGPALVAIGKVTHGIGDIMDYGGKLINFVGGGQMVALLTNPATWVVAAIAAVVAILVTLYTKSETFRNTVNTGLKGVMQALQVTWDFIKAMFKGIFDVTIKPTFDLIKWLVTGNFSDFKKDTQALWDFIKGVFSPIGKWFGARFDDVKNGVASLKDSAVNLFRNMWNGITGVFSGIGSWFRNRWNDVVNGANSAKNSIGSHFRSAYSTITNIFYSIGSWFSTRFYAVIDSTRNTVNRMGDYFRSAWNSITGIFGGIGSWFSNRLWSIVDAVSGIRDRIVAPFRDAWDRIQSIFNGTISLPHISLPHFYVNGSLNPMNWFKQGLPSIGIDWYAKAMNMPYMFDHPSIIGVGEAGREVVVGADWLKSHMASGKGVSIVNNFTINQQPGEDMNTLVKRITERQDFAKARGLL